MALDRNLIAQLMHGYRPDRNRRGHSAGSSSPSGFSSSAVELFAGRSELLWVELDRLDPHPLQPRTAAEYQQLAELKESLLECGQIVPAIARREGDRYRLLEGHRRWHAWKQIQEENPALPRRLLTCVIDCRPEEEALLLLVANLNRREFHYFPLAHALHEIIRQGVMQKDIARAIGWDPALVSRYLRLLKLPPETQEYLRRQNWPFRRINLAIDKCQREGMEPGAILPENLSVPSFALPSGPGTHIQTTRRFIDVRLRVPRPSRQTSPHQLIQDYFRFCMEGLQQLSAELGMTVAPETLSALLYETSFSRTSSSAPTSDECPSTSSEATPVSTGISSGRLSS